MNARAYYIVEWDSDDELDIAELPTVVGVPVSVVEAVGDDPTGIADYLSDCYGFLVLHLQREEPIIERAIEVLIERPEWAAADRAERRRILSKLRSYVRRTCRKGVVRQTLDLTSIGGPMIVEVNGEVLPS